MIVFVIGMFYLEKKFWKQTMGRIIDFIKANYLPATVALFLCALYVYYNANGNSICDCESTEITDLPKEIKFINHFIINN
jgi:hypothetical protein